MTQTSGLSGPAWDLDTEYAGVDDARLQTDLDVLQSLLQQARALQPGLQTDAAVAAAQQTVKLRDAAAVLLANVSSYAHCLLSVDAEHVAAQALEGQLQSHRKQFDDVFEPWAQFIDRASDAQIEAYLSDPEVAPAAFAVQHSRLRAHEKLSLGEENLVNALSQDGLHAWGRLYDRLAGGLKCEVLVDNEAQHLGLAEASGRLTLADARVREDAWRAINTAWRGHAESCAAAINAIAGWRLEMCEQRGRQQPVHFLDAPVHMNRISRATLDALMQVAAENRGLVQRAAGLQAQAMGKSHFAPWDVRAPAPTLGAPRAGIDFTEAVALIADAYGQVHPDLSEFVHMMAERRWIEGTVGPRKAPGAYCTGFAKSRTPRVYMTYTGGQSDVITLAHELGHALHAWVMRELPECQRSYGMSLAETASTFGETLVRDALLARSHSAQERMDMLWEEMSALTSFLLNIPTRFEFERRFYERRRERPLQVAELNELMRDAWHAWYGPVLAEADELFWVNKLHFYISELSFYNFPYLFGYLFSLGVYARRGQMGDAFYPQYLALLQDTGRMSAEDLAAKHLGVRLDTPHFWQQTMDSLAVRVDAFAALLDEVGDAQVPIK